MSQMPPSRGRGLTLHLAGMAAIAAASISAIDRIRIEREQTQREKESVPHGPEVSRQVRRKLERQRMKRIPR